MSASGPDPEIIREAIRQYAEGEKDAYDSASALQEHMDKLLTWLLGLMGAGLIAGLPMLKNAPWWGRLIAVAPWLLGIVAVLLGRTIGWQLRSNESLWHFEKAVRIRSLLVRQRDWDSIARELSAIVNREDKKWQGRHEWTLSRGIFVDRCYYTSLALFGVGMVSLIAVAIRWAV